MKITTYMPKKYNKLFAFLMIENTFEEKRP